MKKDQLYKRIMENVSSKLKNILNEDFQFDDTEVADKLLELIKRDKQIQNIVKNASIDDWTSLVRGIYKLVKSGNIPENPEKISNIVQLAAAFIQRGLDSKLQEKIKEMGNEDFQYTAKFLMNEVRKSYGEKTNAIDQKSTDAKEDNKSNANEQKTNEGEGCDKKGCSEGEGCKNENCSENKKVSEAKNYKISGRFSKYLAENHKYIRPGKK